MQTMNSFFKKICFGLLICLMVTSASATQTIPQIKVVASFSILGDWLRQVGGERLDVDVIVGPNADVHVYEPKPRDLQKIVDAKFVFINGFNFEFWLERLLKTCGFKGLVCTASDGVKPRLLDHGGQKVSDPHIWNSLTNAIKCIKNIRDFLIAHDPEYKALYNKNAAAYIKELLDLDAWAHSQFDGVPKELRKVITAHDAFGYLGEHFDIQFLAPVGISTDAEPSAKSMILMMEQIKREKIRALFVENITNPQLIEKLGKEVDVKVGGVLYSDALSLADGPAPSYIALVRHNVTQLATALKRP